MRFVVKYKAANPGRKVMFQEVEARTAEEAVLIVKAEHGRWAEVILGVFKIVEVSE